MILLHLLHNIILLLWVLKNSTHCLPAWHSRFTGCLQLCKLQRLKGPVCKIFKQDTWSMYDLIYIWKPFKGEENQMNFKVLWAHTFMNVFTGSMLSFDQYKNHKSSKVWHTGAFNVRHCNPLQCWKQQDNKCWDLLTCRVDSAESGRAAPLKRILRRLPGQLTGSGRGLRCRLGGRCRLGHALAGDCRRLQICKVRPKKRRPIDWSHAQGCNFLLWWDSRASTSPI